MKRKLNLQHLLPLVFCDLLTRCQKAEQKISRTVSKMRSRTFGLHAMPIIKMIKCNEEMEQYGTQTFDKMKKVDLKTLPHELFLLKVHDPWKWYFERIVKERDTKL